MGKDMGWMVEDLLEGRVREVHLTTRSDFTEAFKGQTIVDYGKIDGTFEDGEDWGIFEAVGPKRVDLTGLMTKVETTD